MSARRWTVTIVVALVLALVAGWLALLAGPDRAIACGSGQPWDRVAEDVTRGFGAGTIDGAPGVAPCLVPAESSWFTAIGAAFVVIASVVAVSAAMTRTRNRRASVGLPG